MGKFGGDSEIYGGVMRLWLTADDGLSFGLGFVALFLAHRWVCGVQNQFCVLTTGYYTIAYNLAIS